MDQPYHIPVLARELVSALQVKPGGVYADCTFGGGGHSGAILRELNQAGRLIAFDQDEDARLNIPDDPRITFVPHNFRHLKKFLRLHKIEEVDGVIADLGVSSHQFDKAARGFSTRFDESLLDMRMDQRQELTAAGILNSYTEQELHKMFEQYGEVTNAKTLAKTIVQQRQLVSIKTVNEFKNAVSPVVKGNPNKYFAQVFQALRITVNDEMGSLREMLQQLPSLLKKGGRIAIITFHSIEDRMVKHFFRNGSFEEMAADSLYGTKPENPFLIITKKPILPSAAEIAANPRSRSAKLRVAERK
ncbi:16S rRNA (cytosine(1402)-N(4))-methyltransferase RsmH [Agriterribacter sp.]|uniref:16S rRNA (cytosine(1402)-N(4))-methyltransferase RsmH n=1 Tax=Agriterribacter sp. TaxID=2821509 RepID=UPI002C17297D|nr:16S rRNA (cytosine(1402)-N(4))-methyltransferase RsmH [Agriterribacter sp.]HRO46065.1 16S rRNA (cytosine(1402)-N(4))-methyltransferase RsmH [Agriterribacter sp.]HRQ16125.1 16S rRNA (cytosine(1402)-N(4))-methyltransferase RsmH [Agriterribacter sp.]